MLSQWCQGNPWLRIMSSKCRRTSQRYGCRGPCDREAIMQYLLELKASGRPLQWQVIPIFKEEEVIRALNPV